jgi:chaperone required for assembly of F1-ATPase
MKRFYKNVSVEDQPEPLTFAVMLDQKPVQTPARKPLHVPGADLAEAIAAEWDAQSDEIAPERMPLTQVAATALDRVTPDIAAYTRTIAAYGETDLVCYRAHSPQTLVARQSAAWQPLVDWAADAFAAPLTVTGGVAPVVQPSAALLALQDAVAAHDVFEMAALGLATAASGSLIIALALSHGRIDAAAAFEAGFLDEIWQVDQWGLDEDAQIRQQNARADIDSAALFFELHRTR